MPHKDRDVRLAYRKRRRAERWLIQPEEMRAIGRRYKEAQKAKPDYRESARLQAVDWYRNNRSYSRLMIRLRSRGLTLDQFHAKLEAQDFQCAICGSEQPSRTGSDYLSIDHSHTTGSVRGLLCHHCNSGLGSFRDDPARLSSAIAYLERHHGI